MTNKTTTEAIVLFLCYHPPKKTRELHVSLGQAGWLCMVRVTTRTPVIAPWFKRPPFGQGLVSSSPGSCCIELVPFD